MIIMLYEMCHYKKGKMEKKKIDVSGKGYSREFIEQVK